MIIVVDNSYKGHTEKFALFVLKKSRFRGKRQVVNLTIPFY